MTRSHKCKSSFSFLFLPKCLDVQAEHDKKIGHNYTKKTVLICSKVTTIAMIALSPSFFLCNQFAILQHNSNIAFQK